MEQYPQFYNLSERRYSCRGYSDRPVTRDLIMAVFDAVRLAPSACNRQPWKFLVIDTPELRHAIQKSYDREWFDSAPVYVVVSIAVEHFCLAATTLGLGTCWVCNFDPAVLVEALSLPEGVEPMAIIPVGYPLDDTSIPVKKRKALEEIVKWGKY